MKKLMTKQGIPIVTKVNPVELGLPDSKNGFDNISVGERTERLVIATRVLGAAGYEKILYQLFSEIRVGAGLDDLDKIHLGGAQYEMLSSESKRVFLRYRILKYFEQDYKPVYIEISGQEAKDRGISKEELETMKLSELKLRGKNRRIEMIDFDKLKRKGNDIDSYKRKLKGSFLKEKMSELHRKLETLGMLNKAFDILSKNLGLSKLITEYAKYAIYVPNRGGLKELRSFIDKNLRPNDQVYFKTLCERFGMKPRYIKFLFAETPDSKVSTQKLSDSTNTDQDDLDSLLNVEGELNSPLGFSLFLTDFDIGDVGSVFRYHKLKELYEKNFKDIILHYVELFDGEIPTYTGLVNFDKSELDILTDISVNGSLANIIKLAEGSKKDLIYQAVLQFDLPENFSNEDFLKIGHMFKGFFKNIEVRKSDYSSYYRGYIKGIETEGDLEFKGIFESGEGFQSNNILMIRDPDTKKRVLSIGIKDFDLDKFVYIGVQISYFLKKGISDLKQKKQDKALKRRFLKQRQLFADMYYYYNQIYLKSTELFPIDIFPEQYELMVEKLIYPLSKECLKKNQIKIKPQNTLAFGIHGTGKTQFANHLLLKRKFVFNNQEFNLNSNVIPLDPFMFAKVLSDDFSNIRQRLLEIMDNTGLPILLVIEDIDTLLDLTVKQNGGELKTSTLDQMLTTFFEGVGSMPNIYVFTTSNHPEIVSLRLLRQNRLSVIMHFQALKDEELMRKIFDIHIHKNGLNEIFSQNLIKKYSPKFRACSASHIADFLSKIAERLDFKSIAYKENSISEVEIKKNYDKLHVNIKELDKMERKMALWLSKVREKKHPESDLRKNIL